MDTAIGDAAGAYVVSTQAVPSDFFGNSGGVFVQGTGDGTERVAFFECVLNGITIFEGQMFLCCHR